MEDHSIIVTSVYKRPERGYEMSKAKGGNRICITGRSNPPVMSGKMSSEARVVASGLMIETE